jgi:hypothetical protein
MKWFWVPMAVLVALIALGMLIDEEATRLIVHLLVTGELP